MHIKDLNSTHGTVIKASALTDGTKELSKTDEVVKVPVSLFKIEVGGHSVTVMPSGASEATPKEAPKKENDALKRKAAPTAAAKKEKKAKAPAKPKKVKKKATEEEPEAELMSDDEADIPMSLGPDDDAPGPTQSVAVLLTGTSGDEHERLEGLTARFGAVVDDVTDADVIAAPAMVKTPNLLCGLSMGVPVVKTDWIDASAKSHTAAGLAEFAFKATDDKDPSKLPEDYDSVVAAGAAPESGFMEGWEISLDESIPNQAVLGTIITTAGGRVVDSLPAEPHDRLAVLALTAGDQLTAAKERGFVVCHKEAVTYGALMQDFSPEKWPVDGV